MSKERAFKIALELLKLGVSNRGVERLMANHTYEQIERQLSYLPYRRARRPEAFIIDAVRHNYSAPKDFFYAKAQTQPTADAPQLDEAAEPPGRQAPPQPH